MGKSKKSTIFAPENCEEALDIVIRQCDNWADNADNFETPPLAPIVTLGHEDDSTTLMAADDGGEE